MIYLNFLVDTVTDDYKSMLQEIRELTNMKERTVKTFFMFVIYIHIILISARQLLIYN